MRRPRVGCVGVGWIGLARLEALVRCDLVDIVAITDPDPAARTAACGIAPGAAIFDDVGSLLGQELDGVVIATPSGMHAAQCIHALEAGSAVFCQKPLASDLGESEQVLRAARSANRLLAVDFCYRETVALRALHDCVRAGSIGHVFSADLVFHNAYGPNANWAYDPALSGGGCLMDLGVHLVDAACWVLGEHVERCESRMFRAGRPLPHGSRQVEDFATARLDMSGGTCASLACSWRSSFGDHARIRLEFFGGHGGVAVENVNGSFFDFCATIHRGTSREVLAQPPDDWSGRAITNWAKTLCESAQYRDVDDILEVSRVMDDLYGRRRKSEPLLERVSRAL